ncbi:MAG: DUF3078 domain-containing protein [Cytophagales bacterium]
MKFKFYLVSLLTTLFTTIAQDATKAVATDSAAIKKDTCYWKNSLKAGLNMSGSAFSDNWKGGGVNNFNYLLLFYGTANYKKEKDSWDNVLDLQFGQIITKQAPEFRKSQDRIMLDSKYGRAINKNWNLFSSFNAQSFFTAGYKYVSKLGPVDPNAKIKDTAVYVSNFLNPAYFTEALGFEYKPKDWYYVRIGVLNAKQTLVTKGFKVSEVEKNYGVTRGQSWRNEFGFFSLLAAADKDIRKNVNLKVKYQMFFSNVDYFFRRDKIKAKFTDEAVKKAYDRIESYVDQRLDVTLTAKLTKYITTSFSYIGLYDFDQDKNTQHAHNLQVGLLYTVKNHK